MCFFAGVWVGRVVDVVGTSRGFRGLKLALPPTPTPTKICGPYIVSNGCLCLSNRKPIQGSGSLVVKHVNGSLAVSRNGFTTRRMKLAVLTAVRTGLNDFGGVGEIVGMLNVMGYAPSFKGRPCIVGNYDRLFTTM